VTVVVISHGLWQRRFGGDPNIVGKKFPTAVRTATIVGVTPPRLHYPENVEAWMPMSMVFNTQSFPDMLRRDNFIFQSLARLQPGVSPEQASARLEAAAVSALPLNGGGFYLGRVFLREGSAEPPAGPDYGASWNVVTPDYFNALDIGLVKGRLFTDNDNAQNPPVIIISETFAQRMFPNEDPLGKRIRSWRDENKLREIVGVVRDVRYRGLDAGPSSLVYIPHRQDAWGSLTMVVRTAGEPAAMTNAVRQAFRTIDRESPISNVQTLQSVWEDSTARQRFGTWLLGLFAALALCLAGIGIYSVMNYTVVQRTHEIGVRMALGAQTRDVLKFVVTQGMKPALLGIVIGLGASFGLTRLMKSLLFGVNATDPLTFTVIALLLMLVAILACWLPARRATKVDPMVALRYE
jgi:putative ABC transport system permease protein